MPRLADTIYAFRFLRLLTMPWEKTEAFKRGIIDADGKTIKKNLTMQDDKAAYTLFHRLVFNIRRLILKVPGGQMKIANYAAALFLIKESAGLTEKDMEEALDKMGIMIDNSDLNESWMVSGDTLGTGRYTLTTDVASPKTGYQIAKEGTNVLVSESCEPVDVLFGVNIYEVLHEQTKQTIYVTVADIKR